MTKKEMFEAIKVRVADNADMVAFCDHEIELLGRKRSTSKPTKNQLQNDALKGRILEVLAEAVAPMTVGEVVKVFDNEFTSQKISALMRQLVEAGKVDKVTEKKVSRFSLA